MIRVIAPPDGANRLGLLIVALTAMAVLAVCKPASAVNLGGFGDLERQTGEGETQPQSPPDARDQEIQSLNEEIRSLREQVRELMQQLRAAQAEIASLRRQLDNAQERASNADVQAPSELGDLSIPEDEPLASPDTAFLGAQSSYLEQVNPGALNTERERADALRKARRWLPRANREFTGPIEWACEIQSIERLRTGAVYLTIVVIDPVSEAPRSRPHVVEISKRMASSLDRIPRGEPALLGGVFRLDLTLNPDREEAGLFNDPALVGPYVEFGFELVVRSISSVPPEMTQPANANPNPGG